MSYDSYSPITTSSAIDFPAGHRIYTTRLSVGGEYSIPVVGTTMSPILGAGSPYAAHIIVAVSEGVQPKTSQRYVVIRHFKIPGTGGGPTSFYRYQSIAYTFPAIYPNASGFYNGGSNARPRLCLGRVKHEFALPGSTTFNNWLAAPTVWDGTDLSSGPFQVWSLLAQTAGENFLDGDGNSGRVGDYLNMAFVTQDTIHNAYSIYAPGDLAYSSAASIPSVTEYKAFYDASSWLIARRDVSEWYSPIMVRRTYEVPVQ